MNKAIKALYNVQKKMYEDGSFFSKQGENKHFSSKYLQLPDLLGKVVPMLHEEDCVLIQGSRHSDNPDIAIIVTHIIHASGEEWVNETDLPVAKLNPQEMGKAVTYGRRYGLEPLFGIPTVDDDGEGAMRRTAKEPKKAPEVDVFKTLSERLELGIPEIKKKLKSLGIDTEKKVRDLGFTKISDMLKGGSYE